MAGRATLAGQSSWEPGRGSGSRRRAAPSQPAHHHPAWGPCAGDPTACRACDRHPACRAALRAALRAERAAVPRASCPKLPLCCAVLRCAVLLSTRRSLIPTTGPCSRRTTSCGSAPRCTAPGTAHAPRGTACFRSPVRTSRPRAPAARRLPCGCLCGLVGPGWGLPFERPLCSRPLVPSSHPLPSHRLLQPPPCPASPVQRRVPQPVHPQGALLLARPGRQPHGRLLWQRCGAGALAVVGSWRGRGRAGRRWGPGEGHGEKGMQLRPCAEPLPRLAAVLSWLAPVPPCPPERTTTSITHVYSPYSRTPLRPPLPTQPLSPRLAPPLPPPPLLSSPPLPSPPRRRTCASCACSSCPARRGGRTCGGTTSLCLGSSVTWRAGSTGRSARSRWAWEGGRCQGGFYRAVLVCVHRSQPACPHRKLRRRPLGGAGGKLGRVRPARACRGPGTPPPASRAARCGGCRLPLPGQLSSRRACKTLALCPSTHPSVFSVCPSFRPQVFDQVNKDGWSSRSALQGCIGQQDADADQPIMDAQLAAQKGDDKTGEGEVRGSGWGWAWQAAGGWGGRGRQQGRGGTWRGL